MSVLSQVVKEVVIFFKYGYAAPMLASHDDPLSVSRGMLENAENEGLGVGYNSFKTF